MALAKHSFLSKLLQIRISVFVAYILCIIAVIQFITSHSTYTGVPRELLEAELYKAVSPKLAVKPGKPDCKYGDILQSTESNINLEVPQKYDDFSAKGIVNGSYVPEACNPLYSVAILVTYRKRQKQLDIFLPYIHNFLRKQNIHYKIFLVEQQDEKPWNKGLLYNIGARQALAEKFPCLILHDVDLLPLDAGNLYACMRRPRHLSASIDRYRNTLPYPELVGGVLAIRTEDYVTADGFSNRFANWGGEDDDFYERLAEHGFSVSRFPQDLSHYKMLVHERAPRNPARKRVMRENRHLRAQLRDGLSTMLTHAYSVRAHRLYTLIGVKV